MSPLATQTCIYRSNRPQLYYSHAYISDSIPSNVELASFAVCVQHASSRHVSSYMLSYKLAKFGITVLLVIVGR